VKAKRPAIGRKASAAWEEVWMFVTPCAFNVAAVVIMMKSARYAAGQIQGAILKRQLKGLIDAARREQRTYKT
jgi:hypothetical protein